MWPWHQCHKGRPGESRTRGWAFFRFHFCPTGNATVVGPCFKRYALRAQSDIWHTSSQNRELPRFCHMHIPILKQKRQSISFLLCRIILLSGPWQKFICAPPWPLDDSFKSCNVDSSAKHGDAAMLPPYVKSAHYITTTTWETTLSIHLSRTTAQPVLVKYTKIVS